MPSITGIGGVFFKSSDQEATRRWFGDNLGLETQAWGCAFSWRDRENPEKKGQTILGMHRATSDYFDPSTQPFMLNFRVDDLDGMLAQLRERGVEITKVFDPEPNGRFAHVVAGRPIGSE